jgi:hypothetical protein
VAAVVISACNVANFPEGGGHFWVYMQYAHGLRQLGCDVYWLEQVGPADPKRETRLVATLEHRMKRFGLEDKTLLYALDTADKGAPDAIRFIGSHSSAAETVLRQADLLLNFHYAIDPRLLSWARRTALVDIDPGLLQFWIGAGQLAVPAHDLYLTTGETVGKPGGRVPDCGLRWTQVRPPVCLDLWSMAYDPRTASFTTVSSWSSADWLEVKENGKTVLCDNTKRRSFLRFVDLPLRTPQPLELALFLVADDEADRERLERHQWRVRDSRQVAGTPETYRAYIQRSRGEFSCAKPSCMAFRNAWISDRTLCYLASGKPAVVQNTGPSSYLPSGEGLFRFRTPSQAVEALQQINSDYERHCNAARAIAETHFDARRVLERLLNAALNDSAS